MGSAFSVQDPLLCSMSSHASIGPDIPNRSQVLKVEFEGPAPWHSGSVQCALLQHPGFRSISGIKTRYPRAKYFEVRSVSQGAEEEMNLWLEGGSVGRRMLGFSWWRVCLCLLVG